MINITRIKQILGIVGIIIILILATTYLNHKDNNKDNNKVDNKVDNKITTTSSLVVVPKATPSDSNLVIEQQYTATVNNKKVVVPLKEPTVALKDQQVTFKQEIDISKLIQPPKYPKFELGVGVGVQQGKTYFPLSVQYNYNKSSGIQFEYHMGNIKGYEIQHKYRF